MFYKWRYNKHNLMLNMIFQKIIHTVVCHDSLNGTTCMLLQTFQGKRTAGKPPATELENLQVGIVKMF